MYIYIYIIIRFVHIHIYIYIHTYGCIYTGITSPAARPISYRFCLKFAGDVALQIIRWTFLDFPQLSSMFFDFHTLVQCFLTFGDKSPANHKAMYYLLGGFIMSAIAAIAELLNRTPPG